MKNHCLRINTHGREVDEGNVPGVTVESVHLPLLSEAKGLQLGRYKLFQEVGQFLHGHHQLFRFFPWALRRFTYHSASGTALLASPADLTSQT